MDTTMQDRADAGVSPKQLLPTPQRDWSIDLNVPPEETQEFVSTILDGVVKPARKTPHINVLLAAQPKSASLYLVDLLAMSLSIRNHQIGFNHGSGLLYYPRFHAAKYLPYNTISHCHAPAIQRTIDLIKTHDFHPIVSIRTLPDALISRRDMLVRDCTCGEIASAKGMQRFLGSNPDDQMNTVIDVFAPVYLNFFQSWKAAEESGELKPIWIDYNRDILGDHVTLVERIAEALGLPFDRSHTELVIESLRVNGGINFHKGVPGRGIAAMNGYHLDRLRSLANLYGCEDESWLGFKL